MSNLPAKKDDDQSKADFFAEFESLRPDLIYSEGWTPDQQVEAVELLRPAATKAAMLKGIPMICKGRECFAAPSCPLLEKGLAPIGKKCPIEQSFVLQFMNDYIRELDVDVDRMVELSIVRDLVDNEIQHIRKTWALSQEHFITENVVGIDNNGDIVTRKELHLAIEYEDRILKRKERLRNALLATREAKARAGQGSADSAMVVAGIMDEVRRVEIEREKARKRELGIEDQDDYILGEVVEDDYSDQE